jgi:lipoprotein-releasing system permease protein
MFSFAERLIAFRYIRPSKKEGFLSVIAGFSLLGIALGVATLIIVMSVMNGFRQELYKQILGLNGHITVYSTGAGFSDYQELANEITQLPHVESVTPQIEKQVMVSVGSQAQGAVLRGVRAQDFKNRRLLYGSLKYKALEKFTGKAAIIIGARLAENYGLTLGDAITVVAPSTTVVAFGTMPRFKTFEVVDIFEVGMNEYDSNFVYIPLEAAQVFFRLPDKASELEIVINDPDQTPAVEQAIHKVASEQVITRDWKKANSSFFGAIEVERNVMFLILTLIILVAAFNIISCLIMLVKNKTQDIAILRTMGASQRAIMNIFLISGSVIGIVGTVLGFLVGVTFALNIESIRGFLEGLLNTKLFPAEIYFLSKLPAELDWREVGAVVGMSLFLSVVASLYPARKAARLDPVDALRYE